MSSAPKSEELTIEEILEQIRRQAAASPLSGASAGKAGAQTGEAAGPEAYPSRREPAAAASEPSAGAERAAPPEDRGGDAAPRTAWDPQVAVGPVANDESGDLPALLRRMPSPPTADPATPHSARVHLFPRANASRLTDALRKVRAAVPTAGSEPAPKPETSGEPPRREMTSFLDTRFKKLSDRPAPAAAPLPQNKDATAAVAPPAASPMTPERTAALHELLQQLGAGGPSALGRTQREAEELLRPMLKQWLLENMPRLMEKALTIELEENVARTGFKRTV